MRNFFPNTSFPLPSYTSSLTQRPWTSPKAASQPITPAQTLSETSHALFKQLAIIITRQSSPYTHADSSETSVLLLDGRWQVVTQSNEVVEKRLIVAVCRCFDEGSFGAVVSGVDVDTCQGQTVHGYDYQPRRFLVYRLQSEIAIDGAVKVGPASPSSVFAAALGDVDTPGLDKVNGPQQTFPTSAFQELEEFGILKRRRIRFELFFTTNRAFEAMFPLS